MPYRRAQKKAYRRPRTAKKDTHVRKVARQEARKVVNKAVESKIHDGALSTLAVSYSGTTAQSFVVDPTAGTGMTQGTGLSQYIGAVIKPTYLSIRLRIQPGDSINLVRCIIVQVIGGGVPTVANVLQSVGNSRAPLSAFETNYDKTYRILADRTYSVDTANNVQRMAKIKIGYRALRPINFNDNAGTIESNGLYMMFVSDSAATPHPSVEAYWRLHYKDA